MIFARVLAYLREQKIPKEEIARRANAANRLINDETFQEAMEMAQASLIKEWLSTTPEQGARREELYTQARALESVAGQLSLAVTSGEYEARDHLKVV